MSEHAWLVPCCHFFFSLSGFVLPLCTKKKVQCVAFHHEMSKSFWYPDVFSFWCIYSLRQPTSFKSLHTHTHKKQQHCRLMSVMISSVKSQNSARFPLGTLCKLFSTLWSNLYNLEVSQCYDFTDTDLEEFCRGKCGIFRSFVWFVCFDTVQMWFKILLHIYQINVLCSVFSVKCILVDLRTWVDEKCKYILRSRVESLVLETEGHR